MHARAAGEDCETRRSRFNYVRAEVLSEACQTVRIKFPCPTAAFVRSKAATGPEGGIPQIAPAEHALVVTAASTELCSGTDAATHGNVRSVFGPRLLRTTNEAVAALVAPS